MLGMAPGACLLGREAVLCKVDAGGQVPFGFSVAGRGGFILGGCVGCKVRVLLTDGRL